MLNGKPKFDVSRLIAKAPGEPVNGATGNPYRGKNVVELLWAMDDGDYDKPIFVTFKQAIKIGRKVRKGEKSCATVVRWVKPKTEEEKKAAKKSPSWRSRLLPKYSAVFNIDQTDELKEEVG